MKKDLRYFTLKGGYFESEVTFDIFSENAQNKRASIIYGKNGTGKSTLSRLIHRYSSNNLVDETVLISNVDNITYPDIDIVDKINVFNEQFIDDNVKLTTSDGLDTIVMLGNQVDVDKDITEKRIKLQELNESSEKIDINKYYDNKNVSSPLYHKNVVLETLRNSGWAENDSKIKGTSRKSSVNDKVIEQIVASKNSKSQYSLKAKYEEKLNYYDSIRSYNDPLPLIQIDIKMNGTEEQIKELLQKEIEKPIGNQWVDKLNETLSKYGNSKIEEITKHFNKNKDYCPFCLRDIDESQISNILEALRVQQNVDVQLFETDLNDSLQEELNLDTYNQYNVVAKSDVDQLKDVLKTINERFLFINERIQERINDVFRTIKINKSKLDERIVKANEYINNINLKIRKFNEDVKNSNKIKNELFKMNNEIYYHTIKTSYSAMITLEKQESDDNSKKNQLSETIAKIKEQISLLESAKMNENTAAEVINRYLATIFMSKKRLELISVPGKYLVKSNDRNISLDKLSTGERNAISLCYFFLKINKGLVLEDFFKESKLIILDDPITSFDIDNRVGIISFLREVMKTMFAKNEHSKIILFTHKIDVFLDCQKALFDVFKDKEFFTSHKLEDKKLFSLKKTSLYRDLMRCVYKYGLQNGSYNESLTIGNSMRRVLESFSTFNYSTSITDLTSIEMLSNKINDENLRKYYENLMYRLMLNNGSHLKESIYALDTDAFYKYIDDSEKVKSAKAMICLLYDYDKLHVIRNLHTQNDENVNSEKNIEKTIKIWRKEILDNIS